MQLDGPRTSAVAAIPQINTLPSAKAKTARNYRNRKIVCRQSRLDMSGHVIGTLAVKRL